MRHSTSVSDPALTLCGSGSIFLSKYGSGFFSECRPGFLVNADPDPALKVMWIHTDPDTGDMLKTKFFTKTN
jgi:hypothetical protein